MSGGISEIAAADRPPLGGSAELNSVWNWIVCSVYVSNVVMLFSMMIIGEIRSPVMDLVASRRLSLAAGRRNGLALLLRTAPRDASAAATRWVIRSAPSAADRIRGPGPPCFAVELRRNRRGRLGTWIVEWSRDEQQFILATHSQPVADAAADRPHRAAAGR